LFIQDSLPEALYIIANMADAAPVQTDNGGNTTREYHLDESEYQYTEIMILLKYLKI